jgi:hypothetical protein
MALLGIEKTCLTCQKIFRYCEHCWRGHKYCGSICSREGRKKNRRASEKKYAATARGQANRRLRQKNFRNRNILGLRVTDHSSTKNIPRVNDSKSFMNRAVSHCCQCKQPIRVVVGGSHAISDRYSKNGDYFSFARFRSKNDCLSL